MLVTVLASFAAALCAPWVHRLTGRWSAWALAAVPFAIAAYFAGFLVTVGAGGVSETAYEWAPALGIRLSFVLDGLSLLFALLISGVGTVVVIYAGEYLAGHPHLGRFHAFILLFMGSMLGLVLADNLLALFVFWELTSISSYFLIGFDHERAAARSAAWQALLVTGAGGLALLAGFLLLGGAGGSLEISSLLAQGEAIRSHPLYAATTVLVLLGAFTKSAQVPFHFWLPGAMEAPTPVSAYLHSATMVKAGVYLLARLSPVLGGTELWTAVTTTTGAVTMVVGALLALRETDLKLILAELTVSALGILVLFIGLGTPAAISAAIVFLLAHALYKGALFLVVGAVDHATGTRHVEQLGGLRRALPLTAALAGAAALSLAAVPPSIGFIGKELLLGAGLAPGTGGAVFVAALVLASSAFVAAAGIVAIQPFFGPTVATPEPPREVPPALWLGPLLLAALGLMLGVVPAWVEPVLRAAAQAVTREPVGLHLALWHGVEGPLVLSGVSVVCGVALYLGRRPVRRAAGRLHVDARWGPEHWYGHLLAGLNRLAQWQTRLLQNGYLRVYLMTIVVTTVALAGWALFSGAEAPAVPAARLDLRPYEWMVAVLIPVGAMTAITARSRLGAVAALGVVGYGVALVFVLYGAPDLAMTQFMVETLTVILFVLVFYHLRAFRRLSDWRAVLRDAVIALTFGGVITLVVLVGSGTQLRPKISEYYLANSVPLSHGANVVNTILVDFRAFDTLGEITVLAVAGIGVYALLKLKPSRGGER